MNAAAGRFPTDSATKKRLAVAAVAAALAAAGAGWWLYWPRPAEPERAADAIAVDADGSLLLTRAQLQAQGLATAPATAATTLPVPGLPAQAAAPLEASVQVAAPYAGVVTRILVDEGATVRSGQPLARIQSREVLAAQSEQARARAEAAAAAQQARRDAALLAEGIIAAARLEQSQARHAAAQSALQQATGALAPLRAAAGGLAGEYELLAPMAGQVLRRNLAPGQAVAALDAAFLIAEPGPMDLNFSAPLRLRAAIAPGAPVRLPDGATARVVAVGADADPSSQSLRVRARIDAAANAHGALTAGQQFSVSLLLPAPDGAVAVPSTALLPAGDGHVLFVAVDDARGLRVRAVAVQVLGGDETASVVSVAAAPHGASVLQDGSSVVTRGTALLKSLLPLR